MNRRILWCSAALALSVPGHALVGIAVSGGVNSTSISSTTQTIAGSDLPAAFSGTGGSGDTLKLQRGKLSGLTQLGVKAWLELPIIPIEFEAASNIAWGSYKSSLILSHDGNDTVIPVDVSSPFAGLGSKSGSTPYFSVLTDLTLRYRLFELPPLSPIKPFKIWVGAGGTYAVASRVVDESDLKAIYGSGASYQSKATLKNNLLTSTFGGHLAAGLQVKIPVLPLALFVDGKWYLHVGTSSAASKYPFAANAGLGFSI
jgi:hypothetical protein